MRSPARRLRRVAQKRAVIFVFRGPRDSPAGTSGGCDITKITDTAPNAFKLDLACHDINMPATEDNPHPEERPYKEIMLLNRIDERSMFVRKSTGGILGDTWRAEYCPKTAKRVITGRQAKERVELLKRAIQPETFKDTWHLQDGVYANPGTNFEDRCLKGRRCDY